MPEVFGDLAHGKGGTGQLAGAFKLTAIEVAPGGAIEVAGRVAIVPGLRARVTPVVLFAQPLVGARQFATGFPIPAGPGFPGWRRQVRVGPIRERRVANVLDGTGQIVRDGAILMSQLGVPIPEGFDAVLVE